MCLSQVFVCVCVCVCVGGVIGEGAEQPRGGRVWEVIHPPTPGKFFNREFKVSDPIFEWICWYIVYPKLKGKYKHVHRTCVFLKWGVGITYPNLGGIYTASLPRPYPPPPSGSTPMVFEKSYGN